MKKVLIITFMQFAFPSLSAQTNLIEFLNSIEWGTTEKNFVEKYSSIMKQSKHISGKGVTSDYEVTNIILGKQICSASLHVDSITKKTESLFFDFSSEDNKKVSREESIAFSKEMENLLIHYLGNPDFKEDDLSNQFWGTMHRTWFKDEYIVKVFNTVFSDSYIYALIILGIEKGAIDFRVAKWGESKKSVIQKEGKQSLSNTNDSYLFKDKVADLDCFVLYHFTKDKLTAASYSFSISHTNKNDYIKDFRDLVKLLTEKYGEPNSNTHIWLNSLYEKDPENYGFAISAGHLRYTAKWLCKATDVTLALYGDNFEMYMMIQYVSKEYKDFMEKYGTQEKIKNL